MHKYQAFQVAVLGGLVIAVTLLIFQSRALTFKIQALEAERPRPSIVTTGSGAQQMKQMELPPAAPDATTVHEPAPSLEWKRSADGRGTVLAPSASTQPKEGAASAESAPLTPAQEQAVAKSVDRILEEKYGHLPKANKPEDLEKVLERELNLTASQKERITDLFKRKQEESAAIFKGSNPFSGKVLQKAMELDAKYETLVKNELDATQQAKYDQLKKDGKINNGISIQIDAGTDED